MKIKIINGKNGSKKIITFFLLIKKPVACGDLILPNWYFGILELVKCERRPKNSTLSNENNLQLMNRSLNLTSPTTEWFPSVGYALGKRGRSLWGDCARSPSWDYARLMRARSPFEGCALWSPWAGSVTGGWGWCSGHPGPPRSSQPFRSLPAEIKS